MRWLWMRPVDGAGARSAALQADRLIRVDVENIRSRPQDKPCLLTAARIFGIGFACSAGDESDIYA